MPLQISTIHHKDQSCNYRTLPNMKTTRRQFLTKSSAAFAAVNFLPSRAWADSPNGKLNLAHIGVAGMGGEVE